MAYSMTGFARAEESLPGGKLTLEIRTVNHRYLEVTVRMPDFLRFAEPLVRDRVRQRLSRGKVDITARWQADPGTLGQLDVHVERLQALQQALAQVQRYVPDCESPDALSVLGWPGVLTDTALDDESLKSAVNSLLSEALSQLEAARQREGDDLVESIAQRLDAVTESVAALRAEQPAMQSALQARLKERIAALGVEVEPERLAQEVAMLAQKADVAEELDRLDTHVAETRRVLARQEPIGRRLDFLMQEFNREANTLGSKAAHTDYTQAAVDLKVHIEQMREQIQNLE